MGLELNLITFKLLYHGTQLGLNPLTLYHGTRIKLLHYIMGLQL